MRRTNHADLKFNAPLYLRRHLDRQARQPLCVKQLAKNRRRAGTDDDDGLQGNRAGSQRRTVDGRDYIVAPLTLLMADTVLPGSQGALFYPASEVGRAVRGWEGKPLTNGHPTRNGKMRGAADEDAIGSITNVKFRNGRLTADAWFDVEKTQASDSDLFTNILENLERGERIELSTGLFTDNEEKPGRTADGKTFSAIARNHRPDHVAILDSDKGACSLQDGCGVFARNAHNCKCGSHCGRCGGSANVATDDPFNTLLADLDFLNANAGPDDDDWLLPLPPVAVVSNCNRKRATRADDNDGDEDCLEENMKRLWPHDDDDEECEDADDEECMGD
ncbi:MAG: DUF2213 domain-containing protein [Planctomycetes bacterium]|nr:DUF2213 domain-containing protein [Planctomycetota bacterium]